MSENTGSKCPIKCRHYMKLWDQKMETMRHRIRNVLRLVFALIKIFVLYRIFI